MGAVFDDTAVIQHSNTVSHFNGAEAVGDEEGGTAVAQRHKLIIQVSFRLGVGYGRGFGRISRLAFWYMKET